MILNMDHDILARCTCPYAIWASSHWVPSLKSHSCQQVPTWKQSPNYEPQEPLMYDLYGILLDLD